MNLSVDQIKSVFGAVESGVTWSPREGGVCPCCRQPKCPVVRTMPWQETTRMRYHNCPRCGARFKSVEEE